MEVDRVIRTHVTTGELDAPAELISGQFKRSFDGQAGLNGHADDLGINDGSVPLISVVKGLGEYLTSTEDDTRLKGELW